MAHFYTHGLYITQLRDLFKRNALKKEAKFPKTKL